MTLLDGERAWAPEGESRDVLGFPDMPGLMRELLDVEEDLEPEEVRRDRVDVVFFTLGVTLEEDKRERGVLLLLVLPLLPDEPDDLVLEAEEAVVLDRDAISVSNSDRELTELRLLLSPSPLHSPFPRPLRAPPPLPPPPPPPSAFTPPLRYHPSPPLPVVAAT